MSDKKGAMEFSWIFALIVGAIILFFAFYFIGTKLTEQKSVSRLGAESQLDILWSPFASFGSLAETSTKEFVLKTKEKINFSCSSETDFGYSGVSVVTNVKTYVKPKQILDKYIFSEKSMEGKNFQVISKPLEMPWRVADLIYFISKNKRYCFERFTFPVEREFGPDGVNIDNFNFSDCKNLDGFIKVCDSGNSGDCDIKVNLIGDTGSVTKKNSAGSWKTVYFSGDAMMYAAIFSEPEIYDCNVKRLAKRLINEAEIYSGKRILISAKGCDVSFTPEQLKSNANDIITNGATQGNIEGLSSAASSLQGQSPYASYGCRIF
jgi:hypothetical protein